MNTVRCQQHKKGQGQRRCYFQKGGQSDDVALAYELKEMERSCTAVGARVGSLRGFSAAPVTCHLTSWRLTQVTRQG